jgi:hypothetical protein
VAGQNALSNLTAGTSLSLHAINHRSPELISYQEVADWLYYLIKERELSASSVNIAVNASSWKRARFSARSEKSFIPLEKVSLKFEGM